MTRKDTPRKKPEQQPGAPEPLKILRVTPQFHAAISDAGRAFGYSAQKTFDLILSNVFSGDLKAQQDEIDSRLRNAIRSMIEVKKS